MFIVAVMTGCGVTYVGVDEGAEDEVSVAELELTAAERRQAEVFQRAITTVVAAHYQSCAPAVRPGLTPAATMRRFFGTPDSHTAGGQCVDRRGATFDYVSFAAGSFEPDAGRLALSQGRVDAFQRFNCSGFLAATMAAAGSRYVRSQTAGQSPRTFELTELFKRSDSCFVRPRLTRSTSLLPGDVLNTSHGHVIRVLTVGADPLALNQVRSVADCRKIRPENMDFTFAHATSDDDDGAQTGVRVEEARTASTSLIRRLGQAVREQCEARLRSGKLALTVPDTKVGTTQVGFWPFASEEDVIFSLRRHVGSAVPECNQAPLDVIGGRCVASSCAQAVRDRSFWN
jgi:hypothetical protein